MPSLSRLGLFAACWLPLTLSAADAPQKLAVVNVSFVFEKYLKVADVQRRIDESFKARKAELEQRGLDLAKRNQELQQALNGDTADAPEGAFDAVQHLRKDMFVFKRDTEALNKEIQATYAKEMRDVLSDIRFGVKKVAEDGRFDMVLRSPDTDDPQVEKRDPNKPLDPAITDKKTYLELTEPQSVEEVLERFERNPVLYGAKTVDITQDVLSRINTEFMKRAVTPAEKKDAK